MDRLKIGAESGLLISLVLANLAIGLAIPGFYDWTGSEQRRPSPLLFCAVIGIALVALAVALSLRLIPLVDSATRLPANRRMPARGNPQFGILTILLITAAVACFIATWRKSPEAAGRLFGVTMLIMIGRAGLQHSDARWRIVALVAAMYAPFAWILLGNVRSGLSDHLSQLIVIPSVFPMAGMGKLLGHHPSNLDGLSYAVTLTELLIGLSMTNRVKRTAIVYLLIVSVFSAYGSLMLNVGMRI